MQVGLILYYCDITFVIQRFACIYMLIISYLYKTVEFLI